MFIKFKNFDVIKGTSLKEKAFIIMCAFEQNKKGRNLKMNDKKNKKKITLNPLIILIVIAVIIAIIVIININNNNNKTENITPQGQEEQNTESYVEEIETGLKINKSTKLNEAKEVQGLKITNIQLSTKDGMTTLLADVINNSGTKTSLKTVEITLIDKEGNELTKVTGIVDSLDVGDSKQLNIGMTSDYVNAYDFKVEIK